MPISPIRLGVHVSISGGMEKAVSRARELGCSAMQIFSRNPRGWKALPLSSRAIAAFQEAITPKDIDPIVVHTPYLLNLATPDEHLYQRSIAGLALDIKRAAQIGARYVVTHLGSAKERSKAFGQERVVKALQVVLRQEVPVTLLLENSAGAGKGMGANLEELQKIIAGVETNERLGICFDSCHGYAAGYDLRTPDKVDLLAKEINRTMGRERLSLLHLNDCRGGLGSHSDRHEHVGEGKIGFSGFRNFLGHPFFQGIPMILETPKENPRDDLKNLSRIRRICRKISPNLSWGKKGARR
ncbi:MAG: deoxyribonuclease IV [Pseudomonadota bacterium]